MSGPARKLRRTQQRRAIKALRSSAGQPARSLGVSPSGDLEVFARGSVLFVTAPPPDDLAPRRLREGMARRRLVATQGRCPCGAHIGEPRLGADGIHHATVEHEPDCPAADEELLPALEAWRRRTP